MKKFKYRPDWVTPGTRLGFTVAGQDFSTVAPIPKQLVSVCDRIADMSRDCWVKHRHQSPLGPLSPSDRASFTQATHKTVVDISGCPQGWMALLEDDEIPLFRFLEMKRCLTG